MYLLFVAKISIHSEKNSRVMLNFDINRYFCCKPYKYTCSQKCLLIFFWQEGNSLTRRNFDTAFFFHKFYFDFLCFLYFSALMGCRKAVSPYMKVKIWEKRAAGAKIQELINEFQVSRQTVQEPVSRAHQSQK